MRRSLRSFDDVRRRLGPAAPFALVITFAPTLGLIALTTLVTTTPLVGWMRGHPALALPTYFAVAWTIGMFALPTYASALLAGWAFGVGLGLPAAFFGYLGAAAGAFGMGRSVARTRVLPLLAEHPHCAAVQRAFVARSTVARSTFLVALLRLSPVTPFAIANVTFGAAGLDWLPYILGTTLGVLPRTWAVVWIGARMSHFSLDAREGSWVLVVGVVATAVAGVVITRLVRRELKRELGPGRSDRAVDQPELPR